MQKLLRTLKTLSPPAPAPSILLVLLIALVSLILPACVSTDSASREGAGNGAEENGYRQTIITLLETFDGILTTAATTVENELSTLYPKIRPALAHGSIQVQAFNDEIANSLERSQVHYDSQNSRVIISLHTSILDDLENNPVPALSEFAKNLPFIETFIDHGDGFVAIYQNPLEYYLSRMDGIFFQVLFLESFALPLYGEDSMLPFENFLLQSHAVDNFSSFSLFVLGVDREIAYSMVGLSTQLGRGEVDAEYYASEILRLGMDIQKNMEESRNHFDESGHLEDADGEIARRVMYIASSSAITYRSLGSIIFSTALETLVSDADYEGIEDYVAGVNSIYTKLELLVNEVDMFRRNYQNQYVSRLSLSP